MEINIDKLAQDAIDAVAERIKNLKTLNIIVAGKTGVGKSTLINSVFKETLAETGLGKPVTDHMQRLTKKDVPLVIYDTRGFELGKDVQTEVKEEIIETIEKGVLSKDVNQAIHCIWYCISTTSNRIEPVEIEWLKALTEANQKTQVPIIVVLTQAYAKSNAEVMKKSLLEENLDIVQVVPVLAEDFTIEDLGTAKSYGLDVLIRVMEEALPDELVDTLQNVQIASLEEKIKYAQTAVVTATSLAITEAAVPIPLADSIMLVPTQLGMIAAITAVFGFDINKSILTAFLSATLGAGGATILGKTVVANLIKLIPGAGTAAGGAISASTAGAITAALGAAYIKIMELIFKGEMQVEDLSTAVGREKMADLFKSELKSKKG